MPIHDWTRVPAGFFHHFRQDWTIRLAAALNAGRLPKGFSALAEQRAFGFEADVLTLETRGHGKPVGNGQTQTLERPKTRFVSRSEIEVYAEKANRIVVKHHL